MGCKTWEGWPGFDLSKDIRSGAGEWHDGQRGSDYCEVSGDLGELAKETVCEVPD